jgi:hypothetical protein
MQRDYGSDGGWQRAMTDRWIERLVADPDRGEVCVLEGQTRPSFVLPALQARAVAIAEMMLLDCTTDVRRARLSGPRAQPELATDRVECWAAYRRRQADALGLTVVDTSRLAIPEVVDELIRVAQTLRQRRR